jgi:two-component system, NarL family, sensor kinase
MRFNHLFPVLLLLMSFSEGLIAQNFSRKGSDEKMTGMTDQQKVQFINKNFYKLYSADFGNTKGLTLWAAETSKINKWKEEEAFANLGLGVISYLSGDYNNVLPTYFKARDIFDSLQNKSGLASVNNEMAVFYHKQKDFESALECLDVSESLSRETNDLENLGTSLGHRGSFLAVRGMLKEAKPYYYEVFEIRKKTNDSVGLGYALAGLAEISINENNLQQALTFLDQSTAIRQKIGDLQGVAVNMVNKGENYFHVSQYQNAAVWFEKGLKQSLAIGYDDLSRHTYDFLGKSYQAMGDFKKAYALQEKSIAFKDSLFNVERLKTIQEIQTKYETEKKEQQISLLNSENELKEASIQRNYFLISGLIATLLLILLGFYIWRYRYIQKQKAIANEQKIRLREAQISAVIESQEMERRRFASDLHDGMGQMIAALQLSINSIKENRSPENRDIQFENSEQILNDLHNEIRNIAFNLMPPVLIKDGLMAGLHELIRRINKIGNIKIKLSHHDIPTRFSEVAEISLYRISQELLGNMVKHSSATEATLSFTGFDDEVVFTVEDNGVGYNLEKFKNNEGNGWRNIHSRLNLIKGSIEFDVVEGRRNNTIIITLPTENLTKTDTEHPAMTNTN